MGTKTKKLFRIRNYQTLKNTGYTTRINFYTNPVTKNNNFIELKKMADIEEMSPTEFINQMIENLRVKYSLINTNNLKTKTNGKENNPGRS